MSDFAWDPKSYLELMAEEVPDYPRLQDHVVAEATARSARSVLDLGIGSGLTAARVLAAQPDAALVGIDANTDMLAAARSSLGDDRYTLVEQRLEDRLPSGPYDLVLSMLAVHHLDGPGKADLFVRVAEALQPGGRFVLGDLVIPDDPTDVVTPIDGVQDTPSSLQDQLDWLRVAGLAPAVIWQYRDLAVVRGTKEL